MFLQLNDGLMEARQRSALFRTRERFRTASEPERQDALNAFRTALEEFSRYVMSATGVGRFRDDDKPS